MRNLDDIKKILNELETKNADQLEDQDLDFKEWANRSLKESVNLVIENAICMANGGGGTVVFGVKDKPISRKEAIIGVPPEVDINQLKKAVYDSTDPKLTPVFEQLSVPEGTGRLIIMHVYPGLPPYTDTSGKAKIRIGKDCQPLTGSLRSRITIETGETDYTGEEIPESIERLISPSALERLRELAQKEHAPEEILRMTDLDLLSSIGVIRNSNLTRAGLFLIGKEKSIRKYIPGYLWTHLRMKKETEYSDRMDGYDALPIALSRIMDRIMADNPIITVKQGLFHFEYRTYPEIVLREAIVNAFCHADLRVPGPLIVKQYAHKIEISNPGGFVGGVTPENILHHEPVARNPHLVDALTRLRLVNRSNLGVPRMYEALLIEGKKPPIIEEKGDSVKITLLAKESSIAFRSFVEEEKNKGVTLTLDTLLILQYLMQYSRIDSITAANLCQREVKEIIEILDQMETKFGYIEHSGSGTNAAWSLIPDISNRICAPATRENNSKIDWQSARIKILNALKQQKEQEQKGLSNADIRKITNFDRGQVKRLMDQLRTEGQVDLYGKGRKTVWFLINKE